MAGQDVAQIKVGHFTAGIIGLKPLMELMASEFAHKADGEIEEHMLQSLGRSNYIPSGARDKYGPAFVREFRKFMGQPFEEISSGELDIKVLGPGCFQCDNLEKTLMEVLSEIQVPAGVEHVKDIREIASYGIMGVPVLIINGKVVATGSVPPRRKIKEWLLAAVSPGPS